MASKSFSGFPSNADVTPVPNILITTVLPLIEDIAELKTILYAFLLISRRRGYPRFVTLNMLLSDASFLQDMENRMSCREETVRHALSLAVDHGILAHITFDRNGAIEEAYFINTPENRDSIDKIRCGDLEITGLVPVKKQEPVLIRRPDIFNLYEQNIGLLTPIIAEQLQEAEKLYPAEWISDAFREAVTRNVRNLKYILKILERWAVEGRNHGKSGRDTEKDADPGKYVKGRYGHMVER